MSERRTTEPFTTLPFTAMPFTTLPIETVDNAWKGRARKLKVNQSVNMAPTPNGSMVFSWLNVAKQNNQGQLALTSGGNPPIFLESPALILLPQILVKNWGTNNLRITNTSSNQQTPIEIQAYAPGIPGTKPEDLKIGIPLELASGSAAQGETTGSYMQLGMQNTSGGLSVIAFIGGPTDEHGSNAYVVQINARENTGPGTGKTPPEGYYATTTNNSYTAPLNFGPSVLYVANLSAANAAPAKITLRQL